MAESTLKHPQQGCRWHKTVRHDRWGCIAIRRDLKSLEKWAHRNLKKFNKKCKALYPGTDSLKNQYPQHQGPPSWKTPLHKRRWGSPAAKKVTVPRAALAKVLPAGQDRWSFTPFLEIEKQADVIRETSSKQPCLSREAEPDDLLRSLPNSSARLWKSGNSFEKKFIYLNIKQSWTA